MDARRGGIGCVVELIKQTKNSRDTSIHRQLLSTKRKKAKQIIKINVFLYFFEGKGATTIQPVRRTYIPGRRSPGSC